jgi:hypothetical protein
MIKYEILVDVAQLAEHRTVVAAVAGSSPVFHPLNLPNQADFLLHG